VRYRFTQGYKYHVIQAYRIRFLNPSIECELKMQWHELKYDIIFNTTNQSET
jgi:hypothetical protein